jgi:ATP-dependent DNA helicase RecG
LLAKGEADRVERTASTNKTAKFSEAVTAFANDLPNHRLPGYP